MRRLSLAILTFVAISTLAPVANAQSLRSKIDQLFIFGSGEDPLFLGGSASTTNPMSIQVHGAHFVPSAVSQNGSIISFLTTAIAGSVSNAPLSSTSGGAGFRIEGGVPVRNTSSTGPIFGERAQTLGRGRTSIGISRNSSHYTSLRGVPLDDIQLFFTHANSDFEGCDEQQGGDCSLMGIPMLENDVMQFKLNLNIDVDVNSFYVTYGLLRNLDVGVVVPLVSTSLHGRSDGQVIPFGGPTVAHFFAGTPDNPGLAATREVDGSAFGVGDVSARAKIAIRQSERTSIGFLGDIRFPTGDEQQLLGAGELSARGLAILSARVGTFSPHGNVGYLHRGGDLQTDAVLTAVGFDNLVMDRVTIAADLLSELQVGQSKLALPAPVQFQAPFQRTIAPTSIPDIADNLVSGSFGAKYATSNGFTILGNVLVPLNRGGLRATTTFMMGLEYSF